MSGAELPIKRYRGHLVDARLHLLDRQLLDHRGDPVGIVDDLELDGVHPGRNIDADAPAPRVTALLSGKVVATRILGGCPPRSRLHEIRWQLVASVGVVVKLKRTDEVIDTNWVEQWLRDHIIRRIPGAKHAAE
ncbi:hypothetical protein CQY20_10820 [Mycolicibacterium agri]|uniref:PRC-barrel domain-containing protein n=1 Tax=Mycolicibacterium agri TaxID=36811 RepID=A0A2A7N696_MYCAG|nr:hypothetical protein [Mycolicibacterium agri]PEG39370.1 hypothetical protein CQY20_10820 [Mycolicibacterium agri]GFG51755.1 hypothetical protein MAGR_31960 [Mycolicibacterium agri]